MSKRTNLDIKDVACLHIVHDLHYPTSRLTTKSMHTTMVNTPKKILWPDPAGKYGKSTKQSTLQCHQANEGTRGLEAKRVRALEALRTLWSNKKLAAEKRWEMQFLSNQEKEKWIEDYVERENACAKMRVEDAEATIRQELEYTDTAKRVGLTTTEPETILHEMMVVIGDSVSDIASSDDGEDGQDEDDEDTEQGQRSEDDERSWLMGTITTTGQ